MSIVLLVIGIVSFKWQSKTITIDHFYLKMKVVTGDRVVIFSRYIFNF